MTGQWSSGMQSTTIGINQLSGPRRGPSDRPSSQLKGVGSTWSTHASPTLRIAGAERSQVQTFFEVVVLDSGELVLGDRLTD